MTETQAIERWLPVKGFEGTYEVSDHGRFRRLTVRRTTRIAEVPHVLSPSMSGSSQGRPSVSTRVNRERVYFALHVLVLETFVGPRPPGMMACHYDGNSRNNRLENLRWDTAMGNAEDDRRNGVERTYRGEDHHGAKLTDDDIRAIRAEPAWRGVCTMLARCFGMSVGQISDIRAGRYWAKVPQHI